MTIKILRKIIFFVIIYLVTSVVVLSMFYVYAAKIGPNWIQITQQPVFIRNLPTAFEGYRIVQISDLHGKFFEDKELVKKVNSQNPDVVVITGDVFDDEKEVPLDYADSALGGLSSRQGVYFVFGNNDFYLNQRKVKEKLASLNIKTLLDENVSLSKKGEEIEIIGVNDPHLKKAKLAQALNDIGPGPRILLAHSPEIANEAANAGIDLVLVGHTHGGQIILPFIPRVITYVQKGYEKYVSGLYNVGSTQMYVNRGLGVTKIPMRFLARPEITVITLRRGTAK